MPKNILPILLGVVGVAFVVIVALFIYLQRKNNNKKTKYLRNLVQGTQAKRYSMEIFYQRFYLFCMAVPGIKRYTEKLRRRIEIINLGDEYLTRQQTAKILSRIIPTIIFSIIAIMLFTNGNKLLMVTLILLLIFLIETLISGAVDNIENKLLREQIEFFAEIRHAYHEYNMVEEAIDRRAHV